MSFFRGDLRVSRANVVSNHESEETTCHFNRTYPRRNNLCGLSYRFS